MGHLSSPGCRTSTDHRCLIGCCRRLGVHACSPRAAPLGLDDWVAPFHAWEGHKSWCLMVQSAAPLAIFLHHQALKFVSSCQACCQALLWRASLVGCSSLEDDWLNSLEGVSSLGLVWHRFHGADWIFSMSDSASVSLCVPKMWLTPMRVF